MGSLYACSDFTGPRIGAHYLLRTIVADSLPAPILPLSGPDSAYPVVLAQDIYFDSESTFIFAAWYAWVHLQPDGGEFYDNHSCSQGPPLLFRQQGDTIFTGPTLVPGLPKPPVPVFFLIGPGVLIAPHGMAGAPYEYRYTVGPGTTRQCP